MRAHRKILSAVLVASPVAALGFFLACSSTEDETVSIVTACDVSKLDTTPEEVTVKLYLETATELATRATGLEQKFKDVCNTINKDLGEPEGADIRTACNRLAARIDKANKSAPDGGSALVTPWVVLNYPDTCAVDPTAEAKCLDQCGKPGCDPLAKCPKDQIEQTCNGACTGTCEVEVKDAPCVGECIGVCAVPDGGAGCVGECRGKCSTPRWVANCATGCSSAFFGECGGQCDGTCDGQPVGVQPSDGGVEGGAEGGAPDAGPPVKNCTGTCKGKCSALASGSCAAACTGEFTGGACQPQNGCKGTCNTPSTGCTTTCTGTCRSNTGAGTCTGVCSGGSCATPTGATCKAGADCDGNIECKSVCKVRAALSVKCPEPKGLDIRVAGDLKLYEALQKNLAAFAALANEAVFLNRQSDALAERTTGDYRAIGIRRDYAYKCVEAASAPLAAARATLKGVANATLVLRGSSLK